MNAPAAPAPLEQYRIVGFHEEVLALPGGHSKAAGSCDHCGTGIRYVVDVQHTVTGARMGIGMDCAQRIGMSRQDLRQHYASFRAERAASVRREDRVEREARLNAELGEHGTEARLDAGCYCAACVAAAPHGHALRYARGRGCTCDLCLAGAIARDPELTIRRRLVLVDLATGAPARARLVSGQYGMTWCVTDAEGHVVAWVKPSPKRRSTIAGKGYTEAHALVLGEDERDRRRGGTWFRAEAIIGWPTHDTYGEPLPA